MLISNSMLVPKWATWDEFRRLEALGLTMYGQMTAGSWIYIGTQGILQGTYETFAAAARKHFGGSLRGRLVVTGGLGGMGGAQPLAATFNDGVMLAAEVDPHRVERRLQTRYLDKSTHRLDEAIAWAVEAKEANQAVSIAWVGNQADLLAELIRRNITPDVLTDQTSAHDPLNGYVPNGILGGRTPPQRPGRRVTAASRGAARYAALLRCGRKTRRRMCESFRTMNEHVRHMLELQSAEQSRLTMATISAATRSKHERYRGGPAMATVRD